MVGLPGEDTMSLRDVERLQATNYPYQKDRADRLQRLLAALISQNGPIRVSQVAIEAMNGPHVPQLVATEDPQTRDLILSIGVV
jgi:hypothetical protein